MRRSFLVMSALVLLTGAHAASGQDRTCLHGPDETPGNRTRREKAVALAYDINAAQQVARRLRFRSDQGGYVPLEELRNVPATPAGFRVQLLTDGATYAFSVKDMTDPCLYAVFSDQAGDVYEATPVPDKARLRLLSRK
jgi:hypothetical protein